MKTTNIEVLAPIGKYSEMEMILASKCDAVYLGGIEFNMRMHSQLLNFSNEDIKKTVKYAHSINKKIYITVNVWFDDTETKQLIEYLKYLEKIKVDAIIIQDLGILQIMKDNNIDITLHASVMMNIHNQEQVKFLVKNKFDRFVASREMSLTQVKQVNKDAQLEVEYFVSGDMCSVQGSLCYYSGILYNKSANKGQCFKMCRWQYNMLYNNKKYKQKYYLAAKDMDLINHVDALIANGVNSFKIEGRRRPAIEIIEIINSYKEAIELYLREPLSYKKKEFDNSQYYLRETTTAYAIEKPELNFINNKNEEKHKIFSKAAKEIRSDDSLIKNIDEALGNKFNNIEKLSLTIRVQNLQEAKVAIDFEVEKVFVCLETFNYNLEIKEIQKIINIKKISKVFLVLPSMELDGQSKEIDNIIDKLSGFDGLVVATTGHINKYKHKFKLITNHHLNVLNTKNLEYLFEQEVSNVTLGLEASAKQLNPLLSNNFNTSMLVYGRLTVMLLELDLYKNIINNENFVDSNNSNFDKNTLVLENLLKEQNPIYRDNFNRNHFMSASTLNLLPLINKLNKMGLNSGVIDIRTLKTKISKQVIDAFIKTLDGKPIKLEGDYFLGSLAHTKEGSKYVITKVPSHQSLTGPLI